MLNYGEKPKALGEQQSMTNSYKSSGEYKKVIEDEDNENGYKPRPFHNKMYW